MSGERTRRVDGLGGAVMGEDGEAGAVHTGIVQAVHTHAPQLAPDLG